AAGYTDSIPVQRLVAPAVVIDCSKEAAADEKFVLEPAHIAVWEGKHGRIPKGAWVLMRTDWSKRDDPARFLNMKEAGPLRRVGQVPDRAARRQRLGRRGGRHRPRPGVRVRAGVSGASFDARREQ